MPYADGTFTSFKQQGPARVSYPFLNAQTKDKTTKRYDITGWILPANYTPLNALSTFPGDSIFSADNTAYLVRESEPRDGGGYYIVDRAYSKIPGDQVEYTTRLFVRPVMNDIKSGNTYAVSFDDGETSSLFTSRLSVSAVGDITQANVNVAVAAQTISALPSATFSIRGAVGGTDTPNFTSAASSIQSSIETACNLTSVTVTKSYDTLVVSWVGLVEYVSCSESNIEVSGGAGLNGSVTFRVTTPQVTDVQTPLQQPLVRAITTGSAHSGAAGSRVAFWNGDRLLAVEPALVASGSSITVQASAGALAVGDVEITHCAFEAAAASKYVNGPKDCSVKRTTKFYLPGVSVGITTGADIPVVSTYADPLGWLSKIVSADNYVAVATSELAAWEGPILMKSYDEIQMSDALETRTP